MFLRAIRKPRRSPTFVRGKKWLFEESRKKHEQTSTNLRRLRLREEKKKIILDHFKDNPCVDCGESNPVVLDFDHRDPGTKRYNVGVAMTQNVSVKTFIAEIAKCDVRCANCHRQRTYLQFQHQSRH